MKRQKTAVPIAPNAQLSAAYAELSPAAVKEWHRVAGILRDRDELDSLDATTLAEYARCWDMVELCEREIASTGLLIPGRTADSLVRNPLLIVAARYRDQLMKYQRQLGMSPSARKGR